MNHTLRTAVVAAAVAVLALAAVGTAGAAAGKGKEDPAQAAKRLKENARGTVTIAAERSTGYASFVRTSSGGDLLPGSRAATPVDKAAGFLAEYGALVGVADAATELVSAGTTTDAQGGTHVSYAQVHEGVPVFGAVVRVHLDAANNVTAVNGALVPDLSLATTPQLSAAEASARALRDVLANPPESRSGADVSLGAAAMLGTPSATLAVYREGLIKDVASSNQLVYVVEVTNARDVREFVFVHAGSGKVVNRYSAAHEALHRVLYESNPNTTPIWQEGDAFPGALNANQQNIVAFSGDSYRHFFNAFGRDSYDGAGAQLRSVNNDPRINCPNANWNGITTNYCNGVTSDDVVAHEWGHAYTEYTHNLIYQWQPGALNESYSDIWGEVVDMLNGAGTDSPAPVRSDNCSAFSPAQPLLTINSPSTIAGDCPTGGAQFGPPAGAPHTGNVAIVNDGSANPTHGCTPLIGFPAGSIAIADRGTCAFVIKAAMAQAAGATALVVANNVEGIVTMAGVDPTITITSVSIPLSHGTLIKNAINGGATVSVTIRDAGGIRENSYRWLMGEDSTAFGGAIRDMWKPGCYGDPGKVSDANYHCATSDAGGVHSNSGVPNHGFALLVDGGTFNGQTIAPIGMVKASHIYWRAQAVYQTPTSGFPEHADALEASCADLIGQPLEGLSTTSTPAGPSGQSITAADCAAVHAMTLAVELRGDPTQCNFQPMLNPATPAICDTKGLPTHYRENFEGGLGGWTLTNTGVFSGWPGYDWQSRGSLPGGRSGRAAFAIDPDIGDCAGGAGDISGVMRMESPLITLPAGKAHGTPVFSFDHYVATEAGWDGGNVKVSINGGAYVLVPAAAFTHNAYNTTLQTVAAGNTNPLAGQPAFSGTDGGKVTGSWGTSQINLGHASLGAKPGDTIRIRFDFGIDGCTGIDGWYVDDVRVATCNVKSREP